MRRKVMAFGILSTILASSFCFPQARGQRPAAKRAPYMDRVRSLEESQYVTKVVLKNGMTILVNEYRANPVVDIMALVKAGYQDEPEDLSGIAAILSRMMFKTTANRPAGIISQDLKALGGILSSSVGYNHSTFDIVIPAASWKRGLEVQADALLNPTFDPDEVKREEELILSESKGDLGRPMLASRSRLLELGFAQHRVRLQPLVSAASLPAITPEKLLQFCKATYEPSRIIIVVAGDVIASDVLNEATRLYENAKTVPAKAAGPGGNPHTEFQYGQLRSDVPFSEALFGFHVPGASAAEFPATEVLRAMLGTGAGSALRRRLVVEKKIALRADADLLSYSDLGYLTVRVEMDPKDIVQAELDTLTEIELLKSREPEDDEMARACAQLERQYWITLQTVNGRAHMLAGFEARGGWKGMNGYLARIRQVKPAEVVQAAAKYLRLENCSLLEVLPATAEPRNLTAETALRTLRQLIGPSVEQETAEREKEVVPALSIPTGSGDFKFSEIRYPLRAASILRGPELSIREDHTAPLIQMGFFFPGGKLLEKKENQGITELTLHSMLQSSAKKSAVEIYRQLDIYGAEVMPVVSDDFFGFYVSTLSKNIEGSLEILGEMVNSPKFDKDEVGRQKQLQLAEIQREKSWDAAYPCALAAQALFKDIPYSFDAHGSEATLAALSDETVRAWHAENVKNRKPLIVIIGDTQGTSLASYFVSRFSGSRFQEVKMPDVSPKAIEQKVLLEQAWGKPESVACLGFQAPPEGDEDSYAVEIIRSYLSGTGGKLTDSIRNRQALAYDVSVDYQARAHGGGILACAVSDPGNEEKAAKALQDEIQRLADGISYREFRSAVNTAVARYWVTRQSKVPQIFRIVENILAGKGIDGYEKFADYLSEVNQDDLQEVARRIFKMDKSVTLRLHGQPEK